MEITVTLTRKDFADFNKYVWFKKWRSYGIYFILVLTVIVTVNINLGQPIRLIPILVQFVVLLLIVTLIFRTIFWLTIILTSRLPLKNGSMLGKKKYIIADEGFIEEGEANKNVAKWVGVKSIEQNKKHIFIFVDTVAGYIIPKRYFENEAEQILLLSEITKKKNAT